jgi:hypothetical protein
MKPFRPEVTDKTSKGSNEIYKYSILLPFIATKANNRAIAVK